MLFTLSLLGILALAYSAPNYNKTSNHDEINNYILGLKCHSKEVLAYPGEKILDPGKPKGYLDSKSKYHFTRREKRTKTNDNLNLGIISHNDHRIYPGVLVRANKNILTQTPDVVAIDRNPIRYTVQFPGLTNQSNFDIKPIHSEYLKNLEATKNTWLELQQNKPESERDTPAAVFTVEMSNVRSRSQLQLTFGLSADIFASSIDFDSVNKDEKVVFVYKFVQNFFKVSVDSPNDPADVFGPNVNLAKVTQKFDNDNPPLLVDSVTYGRVIYVTAETTSTENEVKTALSAKFTKISGSAKTESSLKFNDLRMTMFVYGGSPGQIDIINCSSFEEVTNIIMKYGEFGRRNPGVPIFYSTVFLKDNAVATVSGTTEFTDFEKITTNGATITIDQDASFITRWFLTWDEEEVNPHTGAVSLHQKEWHDNAVWKMVPFLEEVPIPGNAKNINFRVEWWKGVIIGWEVRKEIRNVPLLPGGRTFRVFDGNDVPFDSFRVAVTPDHDLKSKIK